MSNGGWQPPQSGDAPPPSPGPSSPPAGAFQPPTPGHVPGAATQPLALESSPQPPSRSKGKVIAAAVGAAAIVGAGIFGVTRISGDSASGGASSPEEAGQSLVDAIDNEDLLGAVDILLPGERETLRQPMTDLVDELRRLEVLSDDADLSAIGGVDIVVEDSEIEVEETNVEDIANLRITLDVSGSLNGDDLPIGDLVLDNVDADPGEIREEAGAAETGELPLTVVREDGRWYVSLFYTVAEQARLSMQVDDIPTPEQAVPLAGGDSPEDAVDSFIEGLEALDVEQIIGSLNPNEFAALQRYAPLFLEDAQHEMDSSGLEFSIDEPAYDVTGEGDTRSVTVSYIAGEISSEGETVGFSYEDGCAVLTPPEGSGDEPIDTCELMESPEFQDMFDESSEDVQRFLDTLAVAFDDYENPGLIVKQVDDQWFVSPLATGSEQVLEVLRALDREEIEQLVEDGAAAVEDVIGSVVEGDMVDLPDEFVEDPLDETADTIEVTDETISDDTSDPDFTIPDVSMPDVDVSIPDDSSPDGEGIANCFAADSAEEATACYQELFDAGEIDTFEFPVYLRLPDCGLADLYWSGEYYSLPDAEFVAVVEDAAPCFQTAAVEGDIDEFEVPTELSHPDCLEGRNVYAADDEQVFSDFLDCVMG